MVRTQPDRKPVSFIFIREKRRIDREVERDEKGQRREESRCWRDVARGISSIATVTFNQRRARHPHAFVIRARATSRLVWKYVYPRDVFCVPGTAHRDREIAVPFRMFSEIFYALWDRRELRVFDASYARKKSAAPHGGRRWLEDRRAIRSTRTSKREENEKRE